MNRLIWNNVCDISSIREKLVARSKRWYTLSIMYFCVGFTVVSSMKAYTLLIGKDSCAFLEFWKCNWYCVDMIQK